MALFIGLEEAATLIGAGVKAVRRITQKFELPQIVFPGSTKVRFSRELFMLKLPEMRADFGTFQGIRQKHKPHHRSVWEK